MAFRSLRWRGASACRGRRCIGGCAGTRPGPGGARDRSHRPPGARTRWTPRSRSGCSRRAAHPGLGTAPAACTRLQGGGRAVAVSSAIYRALMRARADRPERPVAAGRRIQAVGTWRCRWSCGSWTSWAASCWPTAGSARSLTGVDDHSRFSSCAGADATGDEHGRCARHFAAAMRRHGVPQEVLTDNGKVFTGSFGGQGAEVLFDRICRENGIDHLLTAPGGRRPPARSSGSTARCAASS